MFDIADYVETRLTRARHSGGKSGDEWTAECPRCGKWGKWYCNAKSGAFLCNSCDFKGKSVVGLVAEVEGITNAEARAFVFRKSVEMRRRDPTRVLRDRIAALRPHAITEEPDDEFEDEPLPRTFRPVWTKKRGWDFPVYLKQRKILGATARAWGMGYCRTGRYAGRLVIPIECPNGRSFTARDMTGDQEPKYLNPSAVDHARLLIGWSVAPLSGDIVLVEGPLDAVRLYQHSISALALGGKVLHDAQLDLLRRLSPDQSIVVMLDPEEETAPFTVAKTLLAYFDHVYIARLPLGVDPGSSSEEEAHAAVDDAKEWKGERTTALRARLRSAKAALTSRL